MALTLPLDGVPGSPSMPRTANQLPTNTVLFLQASRGALALTFCPHIRLRACLLTIELPPGVSDVLPVHAVYFVPRERGVFVYLDSGAWMDACLLTSACFNTG